MAPFFALGFGCATLAAAGASSNRVSFATYRSEPQKQTSTTSALVDFAIVNKLGDNFHKLYGYLDLPTGWNGYDGKKFSKKTIERTLSILKNLRQQPQIFPTGRGSVQLEYHFDEDNLIEMEVSSDEITAYWVIRGNEKEEDISTVRLACKKMNEFVC